MSSETITRNDLTNILNEVLPPDNVDYVIAQGVSGDWTYRKWDSGVAECWGAIPYTTTCNTAWGSEYITPKLTLTFPTGLFTTAPTGLSMYPAGSASVSVMGSADAVTNTSMTFYMRRQGSVASISMSMRCYLIGTWK